MSDENASANNGDPRWGSNPVYNTRFVCNSGVNPEHVEMSLAWKSHVRHKNRSEVKGRMFWAGNPNGGKALVENEKNDMSDGSCSVTVEMLNYTNVTNPDGQSGQGIDVTKDNTCTSLGVDCHVSFCSKHACYRKWGSSINHRYFVRYI